jgi:hypothetical protein
MQEKSINGVHTFGGKHFTVTVEQDQTPLKVRAYLHCSTGTDIETLLQGRGLEVGQLMELSLLTAMATVVVGLLTTNGPGSGPNG